LQDKSRKRGIGYFSGDFSERLLGITVVYISVDSAGCGMNIPSADEDKPDAQIRKYGVSPAGLQVSFGVSAVL
jgi:hypothetical protein